MALGSKEQNFVLLTSWGRQKDMVLRSKSKYLVLKLKAVYHKQNSALRGGGKGGYMCTRNLILLL